MKQYWKDNKIFNEESHEYEKFIAIANLSAREEKIETSAKEIDCLLEYDDGNNPYDISLQGYYDFRKEIGDNLSKALDFLKAENPDLEEPFSELQRQIAEDVSTTYNLIQILYKADMYL